MKEATIFYQKEKSLANYKKHSWEDYQERNLTVNDLKINMAFKVAWAGFMRLGKITYMAAEAKKA